MEYRKKIKALLPYFLTGVFIFLIIRYFIHNKDDLKIILKLDVIYVFCISLTVTTLNIIIAYQFYRILKDAGLEMCTYFNWLRIYFISNFLNVFITQGGSIYRTLVLKKRFQFSYTNSISAITFLTWFQMIFCLVVSIAVILIFNTNSFEYITNIVFLLSGLTISSLFFPIVVHKTLPYIKLKNKYLFWIQRKTEELIKFLNDNIKNYSLLAEITILSFVTFIFFCLCMFFVFSSLNISAHIIEIVLLVTTILISRSLNIVPGNIGITELACGYLYGLLGGSTGNGIIASGVLRTVSYLTNIFWGILSAKGLLPKKIIDNSHLKEPLPPDSEL